MKHRATPSASQRRLVLVGGGHAHVEVLRRFASRPPADSRLTVVLATRQAVYSGMLPGFIAGRYAPRDLEIDVVALAVRAGAQVILSPAVRVDVAQQRLELEVGAPIPYDVAAFDVGSADEHGHVPGIDEHALRVRPLACLIEALDSVLARAQESAVFRVVIAGGGAGGIEIAFTLRERLRAHPNLGMTVVEAGTELFAHRTPRLGRRVRARAEARGVRVLLGRRIVAAAAHSVQLSDGSELRSDALFWVVGAAGVALFAESRLPVDERGFVRTRATLQIAGYDNLFAAGDCATLVEYPMTPKAGVYAVRQGPHLAHNLDAFLRGRRLRSYVPQAEFLMLLNLGDGTAIASKWGIVAEGRWVMWLKDRIDRGFVNRFRAPEVE